RRTGGRCAARAARARGDARVVPVLAVPRPRVDGARGGADVGGRAPRAPPPRDPLRDDRHAPRAVPRARRARVRAVRRGGRDLRTLRVRQGRGRRAADRPARRCAARRSGGRAAHGPHRARGPGPSRRARRGPARARAGADPTGQGAGVNRPGWAARETPELDAVFWDDAKVWRKDREPTRIAIVELDGEPRGYARFHRKLSWDVTGPRGPVSAGEVVALDAAAARALWGVR